MLPGLRASSCEKARNAIAKLDRKLHTGADPAWREISAVQDQLFNQLRVAEGEQHGDVCAVGKAEQMYARQRLRMQEFQKIVREAIQREGAASARGGSVSARIRRENVIILREEAELRREIGVILAVSVQQEQRIATPGLRVKQRPSMAGMNRERLRLRHVCAHSWVAGSAIKRRYVWKPTAS